MAEILSRPTLVLAPTMEQAAARAAEFVDPSQHVTHVDSEHTYKMTLAYARAGQTFFLIKVPEVRVHAPYWREGAGEGIALPYTDSSLVADKAARHGIFVDRTGLGSDVSVLRALREAKPELSPSAAASAARLSGGSLAQASERSSAGWEADRGAVVSLCEAVAEHDLNAAIKVGEAMTSRALSLVLLAVAEYEAGSQRVFVTREVEPLLRWSDFVRACVGTTYHRAPSVVGSFLAAGLCAAERGQG